MPISEDDVARMIRDQFDILSNERGVIFPRKTLADLLESGAVYNAGTAFFVPDTTATNSIVVSDGEGNWNEYVNIGPVS